MKEKLLKYYEEELNALYRGASRFSAAYPKVASRLQLNKGSVEDPMVGQLIEAVAFLTSRIHYQIDRQHDDLLQVLVSLVAPHLVLPIPSFATIEFVPHQTLQESKEIKQGEEVASETLTGDVCRFTTTHSVTLYPVKINALKYGRDLPIKPRRVEIKSVKSFLKCVLETIGTDILFQDINMKSLRFFIALPLGLANLFYEKLFNDLVEIQWVDQDDPLKNGTLSLGQLKPVGFSSEEELLPFPKNSFNGGRLLTEYFAYPEKFFYFDLTELAVTGRRVAIYFLFKSFEDALLHHVHDDALKLFCSPLVNLFHQTGEPILLDHQLECYSVVPDGHLSAEMMEVYRIESMSVVSEKNPETIVCRQRLSYKYSDSARKKILYWQAQRKPREVGFDYQHVGSNVSVCFNDLDFSSEIFGRLMVTPYLICSNRNQVEQIPIGGDFPRFRFIGGEMANVQGIRVVKSFTLPDYPHFDRSLLVDLVQHLYHNVLSYKTVEQGVQSLKDLLMIYARKGAHQQQMIDDLILSVQVKEKTKRHPKAPHQGFCHGVHYTIVINQQACVENGWFLLGQVLSRFLSERCAINSFIELTIMNQENGVLAEW